MCFLLHETEGLGPGEAAAITLAWENRNLSKLIFGIRGEKSISDRNTDFRLNFGGNAIRILEVEVTRN